MPIRTTASTCYLAHRGAEAFRRWRGRKNLENSNWTPWLLQVVEIPQNRQRILWKNLEKKGLVLEILGKKICRLRARS
jgi:hypothetical protein